MQHIDDESIDLIVTSPPYFNARPEYSEWETYEDFLRFLNETLVECFRILKITGRIAINLPDGYGRNPWIPLYADACKCVQRTGFILRGSIVWNKGNSAGKTSWGSWRSSSNPCFIDEHEMIMVAHKQVAKLQNASKIDKEMFFSLIHSVWNIKPETTRKYHPAPYPIEIPKRLITLLCGEGATVLDPFIGSGTTAVACKELGRNYIGFEINKEYVEIANKRLVQPSLS